MATALSLYSPPSLTNSPHLFLAYSSRLWAAHGDVLSMQVMRLKRPMVSFDIRLEALPGDHLTPLAQDFLDPAASLVPLVPRALDPLGLERNLQAALAGTAAAADGAAADEARTDAGTAGAAGDGSARAAWLKKVNRVQRVLLDWLAEVA